MSQFTLWRTALLPVCPGITRVALQTALEDGGSALESQIIKQHLAPLWHAQAQATGFAHLRRGAALAYIKQRVAVEEIDALFEREGLRYAVIKGVATRELAYDDPAVRPCADIDVLVSHQQRVEAARVLTGAGYRLRVDRSLASHEAVLTKHKVDVDLHWDILRPGRTPDGLAGDLLNRRKRHEEQWVLSDPDALFLMLVHAAINKHVSTSGLGLHRAADMVLFLRRRSPNWATVYQLLDACALKTAAWTVLTWLRMLATDPDLIRQLDNMISSLQPGPLRARYLKLWLDRDLSSRLTQWHAARLFAFSALMHDRPASAWRAWVGWRRAMRTSSADAKVFDAILLSAHDDRLDRRRCSGKSRRC